MGPSPVGGGLLLFPEASDQSYSGGPSIVRHASSPRPVEDWPGLSYPSVVRLHRGRWLVQAKRRTCRIARSRMTGATTIRTAGTHGKASDPRPIPGFSVRTR